jgi:signal transduction histidine kinase
LIGLTVYGLCIVTINRRLKANIGIRRVELQFLALNAGGAALILLGLNALGNLLENRTFNRLSVVLLFVSSALTACALLLHRVFNAWEVFLQLAQRLSLALILCGGIYMVWHATNDWFAEPFGLLFSIAVFSPIAVWLDRKSRTWFDFAGELKLSELRQHAIEIERSSPQPEQLVERLTKLLCAKFEARSAYFLTSNGSVHNHDVITLRKDRAGYDLLCQLGWATPESLDRRRSTSAIDDLKLFLGNHSFGVVLPVPRGSPTPSLVVALGTRPDDRPYTFPEIERIQNVAELIESILSRSKVASQAALYARAEYLNMMSRGLAHDLKNLITPVATFLLHTDRWRHSTPVEADAYMAAQTAAKAMTEYVHETLSFSEQLQPSFQSHRVKDICAAVVAVAKTSAHERDVHIEVVASEFELIVADGVLLQRMLGNLVFNAIEASSAGQTVAIQVTKLQPGWIRFEVRDNGCGISMEHMARILDPYFTTKKLAGNIRGFGLGLTIAQKIILLHRGNINLRSKPGQQTVISVDLPIDQPPPAARR